MLQTIRSTEGGYPPLHRPLPKVRTAPWTHPNGSIQSAGRTVARRLAAPTNKRRSAGGSATNLRRRPIGDLDEPGIDHHLEEQEEVALAAVRVHRVLGEE